MYSTVHIVQYNNNNNNRGLKGRTHGRFIFHCWIQGSFIIFQYFPTMNADILFRTHHPVIRV